MKSIKTGFCLLILILFNTSGFAQQIVAPKGYAPEIGSMVAMLDDLKARVSYSVSNLDQKSTDFLLDDKANRIGALIYHLAATEKYYQLYTFENRGFNKKEKKQWETALNLGIPAQKAFKGKPISYYLSIWEEVRAETKRLLKTKNDKWFKSDVKRSQMNNQWAWFHVMEHQANHMGQIQLILKRLDQ